MVLELAVRIAERRGCASSEEDAHGVEEERGDGEGEGCWNSY